MLSGDRLEPDPATFALLQANIAVNGITERIRAHNAALSNTCAPLTLHAGEVTPGNFWIGAGAEAAGSVEVPGVTFDSLAASGDLSLPEIGIVWMDTQGHEGHILSEAKSLLDSEIPIVIEYWPFGLRRAGGLEMLEEIISTHYGRIIDLRSDNGNTDSMEASSCRDLRERYTGESFTDLLLLKDDGNKIGPER